MLSSVCIVRLKADFYHPCRIAKHGDNALGSVRLANVKIAIIEYSEYALNEILVQVDLIWINWRDQYWPQFAFACQARGIAAQ